MTSGKVKPVEKSGGQPVRLPLDGEISGDKESCMQRRRIIGIALAIGFLSGVIAFAQPKGPTVTVKGEVVDMWCYMESGEHGPSHKTCATACAKGGNPIGIVDSKGDIYIAAGLQDHQPARDLLVNKMSEQVTTTGTLVSKGGLKMLFIQSVR